MMKKTIIAFMVSGLAGCATAPPSHQTYDKIKQEMDQAAVAKTAANAAMPPAAAPLPPRVSDALLPPLPPAPSQPSRDQERFSVSFNEVEARQFFLALAANTGYNILLHPKVDGKISANLHNVTLFEALNSVREVYGYDYTVEGNRIVIKPLTMQTRIFHVNYLNTSRLGSSETRVSAGSGSQQGNNNNNNNNNQGANGNNANQQGQQLGGSGVGPSQSNGNVGNPNAASSRVSSTTVSDFWSELRDSLKAIVNVDQRNERDDKTADRDGSNVVVSRQSGVVVVRAMPDELRAVAQYLRASQLSVERQVILEAKILEVQLNDTFQSGINWASFSRLRDNPLGVGFIAPGTTLTSASVSQNPFSSTIETINPRTGLRGDTTLNMYPAGAIQAVGNVAGSLFGIAVQGTNFAAMLSFLETQGTVHVLSSPRIATINNQKAILKVGTDDFFVTKVSSTVNTSTVGTSTTPDVTLQQFFSGVVLDVTPQIDEFDNIILHVHPSVTEVTTLNRVVNLGQLGTLNLPLASSNTSETDSVVRGQTGQIIAIGGLMRQATTSEDSQVPVAGDIPIIGNLFKNKNKVTQKRELVILIKPTIIDGGASWGSDLSEGQRGIQRPDPQRSETQR